MTSLRRSKYVIALCAVAAVALVWFGRTPISRVAREVRDFASARFFHGDGRGERVIVHSNAGADAEAQERDASTAAVGPRQSDAETMRRVVMSHGSTVPRSIGVRNGRTAIGDRNDSPRPNRTAPSGPAILSTRQRLERDFGAFFAVKELDFEKRSRVIDVLSEDRAESDDIFALSQSEGLSSSARDALMQGVRKTKNDALYKLIGRDATKELYAYQLGIHLAQPFVEQCKSAGVPLSDSAFTAIAENVALNVASANAPLPTPTESWQQSFDTHRASSLAAAEQVLTPQQMNLFRAYWAQHPTRESVARSVPPSLPSSGH